MWQYNEDGREAIHVVAYGGVAEAQIDPGRHMAFATEFYRANKVFTMVKG